METIDDPGLQAYFERTRGVAGIRLVGLREARRELTAALRDGIPVGLVGDRDLTGGGMPIPLFGAPAMLPMGPAMLAVETGVPVYGMTVRRAGKGGYRGRLIPIEVPAEGTRRERVTTTMTQPRRGLRGSYRRCPGPVVGGLLPDLAGPRAEAAAASAARGSEGAAA